MIVCESGGHANGLTYFIFRFLRRPLEEHIAILRGEEQQEPNAQLARRVLELNGQIADLLKSNKALLEFIDQKMEYGASDAIAQVKAAIIRVEGGEKAGFHDAILEQRNMLLKEFKYLRDKHYNSFEPDNQSAFYHELTDVIAKCEVLS